MNKRVFLRIAISSLAAISSICSAAEDREFEVERLELCKRIQEVLLSKNQCTDSKDCITKQLVFCSPAKNGVGIQLWGIENKEVIEGALSAVNTMFVRRDGQMNVSFKAYRDSKTAALARALWARDGAYIEVDFQKEK